RLPPQRRRRRSLPAHHHRRTRRSIPALRPEPRHPSATRHLLRRAPHGTRRRQRHRRERGTPQLRVRVARRRHTRTHHPRLPVRARSTDLRHHIYAARRHPLLRRHGSRRVLLGHQRHRVGPALRHHHRARAPHTAVEHRPHRRHLRILRLRRRSGARDNHTQRRRHHHHRRKPSAVPEPQLRHRVRTRNFHPPRHLIRGIPVARTHAHVRRCLTR